MHRYFGVARERMQSFPREIPGRTKSCSLSQASMVSVGKVLNRTLQNTTRHETKVIWRPSKSHAATENNVNTGEYFVMCKDVESVC